MSGESYIPGDIYEDAFGHPCICIEINLADDTIWGISLIDGSYPRSCSLAHDDVRKLSVTEAWELKRNLPGIRWSYDG